ncbi:putative germin-like protein 2-2 [Camellia sinensis]|uniref:putative germin-like protein 2-2 n=1 Tax=Camellia sinensis TaxID=4442 RepID=UPI001036DC3A|nr:putative germin-like protein 2-2 [Camellia sinensis]
MRIANVAAFVNGKVYNDPKLATAGDFFFSGLLTPQNTSNPVGSKVTPVNIMQILGLNTLSISLAHINFAPYGLNPPHTHPHATKGLIHFQFNNKKTNEVALAALSSQNPRTITVANAMFESNPRIFYDVLAEAFQVDKKVVDYLQAQFWWPDN